MDLRSHTATRHGSDAPMLNRSHPGSDVLPVFFYIAVYYLSNSFRLIFPVNTINTASRMKSVAEPAIKA